MTRIRDLAASMLAALCLLVAGCSDGAAPETATAPSGSESGSESTSGPVFGSPSASPSASSWPSYELLTLEEPSPPVFSGRVRESDVPAIVDHVVAEMSHALRTSFPPSSLRKRQRYCQLCQDAIELADTANDARIVYEHDAWEPEIGEIDTLEGDEAADRYYRVSVSINRPELRAIDEHGEVVDVLPAYDPVTGLVIRVVDKYGYYDVVVWDELEKLQNQQGT